jgi:hypothetical protein
VHAERLPQLGFDDPLLFARLSTSRRGERRLSELIGRRANLSFESGFPIAVDRFRIALLPFPVLDRLFTFAAAASLRRELSTLIDKSSRERMESIMGVEARDFALKEAMVTLGPLCVDHWAPAPNAELSARFQHNRSRCLEDCMAEAPKSLTDRLTLKLPPSWECDFSGPTPADRADQAWSMIRRLLRSKIPEGGELCFA